MAEAHALDEQDADELAEPKGSKGKLIMILMVVLLSIAGGGGAALYFAGVFSSEEAAAAAQDGEKPEKKGKAIYVELAPKFVVNLAGGSKRRLLQVGVQVLTRDADVEAQIKQHLPMIKNKLMLLFSSKTSQELATAEGKETLMQDARSAIEQVLESETGKGGAEAVFFTSFVMQ